MDELQRLQKRIEWSRWWCPAYTSEAGLGHPSSMTQALAETRKKFDSLREIAPGRSIEDSLRKFRQNSSAFDDYLELKYACYGIGLALDDGWRLLSDSSLFPAFLVLVNKLRNEPRRFRKCYQGLLASYFAYPLHNNGVPDNWSLLQKQLQDGLNVASQAAPIPTWLSQLIEHSNLLTAAPFTRYFQGDMASSDERHQQKMLQSLLRDALGVPSDSWLWEELVLTRVIQVCKKPDFQFSAELDSLLDDTFGEASSLSPALRVRCAALLLIRYANSNSRPEHPKLRDVALTYIGNPWLKRTAWDAHVKKADGIPHEAARQMVNSWLKCQLIRDFFELLSDDGIADQRRLNYWLRFERAIDDMWLALGPYAKQHAGQEFREFRERGRGRILRLDAPGSAKNNAFIMKMGNLAVVEFGAKGNACYLYRWETIPFDLLRGSVRGSDELKNKYLGTRFIHRDGYLRWERDLDAVLRPLIDFQPAR